MSPQAVLRRTALDNVATLGRRAAIPWAVGNGLRKAIEGDLYFAATT